MGSATQTHAQRQECLRVLNQCLQKLSKSGDLDACLQLIDVMALNNVTPDINSYNSCILACAQHR
jgi:hypothetical protein